MRSTPISSDDDRIDTRDVIARIDWLTCDHTDEDSGEVLGPAHWSDGAEWEEYVLLRDLLAAVDSNSRSGLDDGITLVRETAWRDYVIDWYADTWGGEWFTRDERTFREHQLTWNEITSRSPFNAIDWDQVARDDLTGHSQITFGGVDYVITP